MGIIGEFLRAFVLLPTWIVAQVARPVLPAKHPWKTKMPSYERWVEGATPLCVEIGAVLTFCILGLLILICMVHER